MLQSQRVRFVFDERSDDLAKQEVAHEAQETEVKQEGDRPKVRFFEMHHASWTKL